MEQPFAAWLQEKILVGPTRRLSVSEERVLALIVRGWDYKEVAKRLRCSPRTVQHHVETIADLLPPDGISPRQRVLIWGMIRAAVASGGVPHAA